MTATTNDTKELILKSALRQFADHGYAAVSLNDIAEEVGIKKAFDIASLFVEGNVVSRCDLGRIF